jgi:hypothetical protein
MRAANAPVRRGGAASPRLAPEPPADEAARGRLVRIDEAVVHDLSHELGNYFHKLFYWTDYIKSGATDDGSGACPGEMLEDVVHRMQAFLNVALEYFQPAELRGVPVSGADVAGALESLLRGAGGEAAVEVVCDEDAGAARLVIDPTRLSSGLRLAARLLSGPGCAALRAHVRTSERAGRDVLEIELSVDGPGEPDARPSHRVVEWAVAGRMIELHGGELSTNEERRGAGCLLTLPLAS